MIQPSSVIMTVLTIKENSKKYASRLAKWTLGVLKGALVALEDFEEVSIATSFGIEPSFMSILIMAKRYMLKNRNVKKELINTAPNHWLMTENPTNNIPMNPMVMSPQKIIEMVEYLRFSATGVCPQIELSKPNKYRVRKSTISYYWRLRYLNFLCSTNLDWI